MLETCKYIYSKQCSYLYYECAPYTVLFNTHLSVFTSWNSYFKLNFYFIQSLQYPLPLSKGSKGLLCLAAITGFKRKGSVLKSL